MKQELIFVVGCARSGTTWVQLLLSQHPAIATLQESHLFPDFIGPGFERWRRMSEQKSETGLTSLMGRAQFIALWKRFAEETLQIAVADKPGAAFILEKTPNHVHYAREILELFPTAYFVHIVRDPRAVVASLLDASRSWARHWAPPSALPAAEMWRTAILNGQKINSLTRRYIEVTYEALLERPEVELARALELLGLEPDQAFCRRAIEACSAANVGSGNWKAWVPKSMESVKGNTVRKGQSDGWRTELTGSQVRAVEYVTRELMEKYGYAPETKPGFLSAMRLSATSFVGRFRHAVGRRVQGALRGV